MRRRLQLSPLVALSLIGASASAFAQGNGAAMAASPGTDTVPPQNTGSAGIVSAPGGSSTTTTGMGTTAGPPTNPNTGVHPPDAPSTSPADNVGAGSVPSGLRDDPAHPGIPTIVGH
jgi:hypothetical protein